MLRDVVNWIKAYMAKSPDPVPSSFVPSNPPFLQPGNRYRVIRAFADYDKSVHAVGEEWTFRGQNFVPYDDGMSWFVSHDGVNDRQIRLQWRREEQADILDDLPGYLASL
ncbi:MAG: DUF3601 domain-containing protein [Gemmatimonadaceae bacterium]